MVDQQKLYPRAFTHIGITVTDLNKAVDFYSRVFGLNPIFGPRHLVADDTHFGRLSREVYGPKFKSATVIFMGTANGVVIELFQFSDPPGEQKDEFDYWRAGCFHICFVDPHIEDLMKRVAECGGKCRTAVWELWAGTGKKLAFCEDPFGNVIEVYSHSTEQMVSNLKEDE